MGAVVAVILQALLVAREGLPVTSVVTLTVLACLLGYPGGKVWYLVVNRRPPREFIWAGACIQGFLLVALSVVSLGTLVLDLPAGAILDATAPGIFLGMAIGRPGCFLTGCCAGRPTLSRWGLWSSDRRLGIRRIPVQLYEAVVALTIGVAGLLLVLTVPTPFPGAVFVGAIAAYTFCRQFLFRLRSQSHTRAGRLITLAVCALLLLAVVAAYMIG
ncbi:MAG: prolipoprotein diacylglyceryl transferase family protein [Acidimicrobiales bacterium]